MISPPVVPEEANSILAHSLSLVIDGRLELPRIQMSEAIQDSLDNTVFDLFTIPSDFQNTLSLLDFTAQAICDPQPFLDYAEKQFGKVVSINFLGKKYSGFIESWEVVDGDISFSFISLYDIDDPDPLRIPRITL